MIGIIILCFLCLGAASMVLRVVLFVLGKSDHRPLGKIGSIAERIGFFPVVVFEWAYYLVTFCVLTVLLAYWYR